MSVVDANIPFKAEYEIIEDLEQKNFTNPKKLIKYAKSIYPTLKFEVQKILVESLVNNPDPIKYLKDVSVKVKDCAIIIEQFVEDGCHGMIMMGNTVYPVKLDTIDKWLTEGKPWHPEDEARIRIEAADKLMQEKNIGYFNGKVVLFPYFGFSGIPETVELACRPMKENDVRYANTKFFVSQKKSRQIRLGSNNAD